MTTTEIVGYAAMAILMFSFTLKNLTKLRMVNTVACVLFVVYGFLLDSYPIVISNAFIVCVNVYYLAKERIGSKEINLDVTQKEVSSTKNQERLDSVIEKLK